ncbi:MULTISPECIES: alpha/beta fold hydrolase [unclassified Streptomyces]|uniref:alpha/beta fold hydrolase n=1 Tax=unclassified Streptomyces TaxID=2593676 RepID=UPI00081EF880|nr:MULTISPECIES: alpha/beta fold hydrolase [unclassified Streptomyces]MYR28354.1 alpha/beta fold hydrolase [Streptomyces sp. SID4945]SCD64255.1 Predicted acyl esterase [Streptomyces sp. TverLS-915]SCF36807.1 Predicted acyl esterase [Streptomyces sp. LcepLS]
MRAPRSSPTLAVLAAALLLTGPAAAGAVAAPATAAAAPTVRFADIPGDGGTVLKGNVVAPADTSRTYPLVVLPTSWSVPQIEYLAQAQKLAETGYVVVTYNSRGFLQSGGEIEVGGPKDVADASAVIDWALAHTPADAAHIGMAGVSYGAGISLLAAGHDPRIKAVAALSGWGDLIDSIYSGRTQHAMAGALLGGLGFLTGRPSAEFQQILKDFLGSNLAKEDEMIAWGKVRSPATYLDGINRNKPAVFLGNAWGDSFFPPNQYADFFSKLAGPKRLEFRPGDHATSEATGLLGLPNDTWTDTRRWLDHYLKGEDNGVQNEAPVHLSSRSGGGYEDYASWQDVGKAATKLDLGGSQRIATNLDSGADGGVTLLSNALDQLVKLPPAVSVPLLPRAWTGVWQSSAYGSERHVRGTTRLHTTVTPTKADGTFVAYLYDVGPLGVGKLVTHAPYTFHDRTPGQPFGVDLDLYATAYDVPAGHKLALVVDTVDPLYIEHNPAGAQLTFSSPAADPSYLSVPLREQ